MNTVVETDIANEIYKRASHLLAIQHALAEVTGGRKVDFDPTVFANSFRLVQNIIRQTPGAHGTFIGGLAVAHHGYDRWTDDIVVVIDAEHFGEILEKLRAAGFILKIDFTLQNRDNGAKLDILKEGTKLKDARYPLPHPRELGPNAGYVTLSGLIRLKLDAHRRQDVADVVRLMQKHLAETDSIAAKLPEEYRTEFCQLADEARREIGV